MSGEWVVNSDGGSRGNPGPGGVGIVVRDPSGEVVAEGGAFLGSVTNNIAEYEALLWGMRAASALGAKRLLVRADSELVVRQMLGQYRVKNPGLRPLFVEAQSLQRSFEGVRFEHVRREHNAEADALANQAMDERTVIGDAPGWREGSDGTLFGREG